MFIIGIIIGFVLNKQLHKRTAVPIISSSLLSPDEKKVIAHLRGKGFVNQKEIGKEMNWSKSKVSAIISNLSYKKMIEKEKIGRNYKVKLIKDIN
jgi:uncharacterized membrane protein